MKVTKITKVEFFRDGKWHEVQTQFIEALSGVAEASRRAAYDLVGLRRVFVRYDRLEAHRARYGGMTEDLRRWPDQWQSFYCAAFLHQQCPTEQYDLRCTCPCHGKP
jgi:hypothetical protein